ncbi:transcription factor PAR2-like [Aristolochia californica]|uniref:transcription factor PAR2-like n=1 Tax=Aristolochia californica TaxID=171875 RepID=UPI0035DEE730
MGELLTDACDGHRKVGRKRERDNVSGRILKRRRRRFVDRSVRMKVRKLRQLVPGGQGLQPDRLFVQIADYILHLRLQVNALQALSDLYNP